MKLADFDYNLPKDLIAQYPLKDRAGCRLMVLDRQSKSIANREFKDICDYVQKGDLLLLNDTKVLPCRLFGSRATGGEVEVLLLKQKSGLVFDALIKPARVKLNEKISFNNGKLLGFLSARNEFSFSAGNLEEVYSHGVMPLPPYIKRNTQELDEVYYQTVYAKENGSVAAPTAGLHFSSELLEKIKSYGVDIAYLTLHVGLGTFKPVKCEDIMEHKMQAEDFSILPATIELINSVKARRNRIFAVGTTSLRCLETFARGKTQGSTDLFIYPGYQFKLTDCLLTNFHLPRTTLFMLVCAFATEGFLKQAYQEAIKEKYRFYSYGDAMLII